MAAGTTTSRNPPTAKAYGELFLVDFHLTPHSHHVPHTNHQLSLQTYLVGNLGRAGGKVAKFLSHDVVGEGDTSS